MSENPPKRPRLSPPKGDLLIVQKWCVHRAKNRSTVIRTLRCWYGKHNPPHDEMFEEYGSVMIGGPCTRKGCNNDLFREICWIGDAWDFPGATNTTTTPESQCTTIHVDTLEQKANEHMRKIGCFTEKRQHGWLVPTAAALSSLLLFGKRLWRRPTSPRP